MMKHLRLAALILISVSLFARSPEEAVRNYIETIKKDGFGSAARLFHPDELAKFRQMLSPVIADALKEDDGRLLFGRFASPQDKTVVRPFSDEEFMKTFWLCIEQAQPQLSAVLKTASIEVLGHVDEGEIKHVVTRMRVTRDGDAVEKMDVISARDFKGEPMIMLTGEIKQLAEALRRQR